MMTRTMPTKSSARDDDELYERVAQILEQARGQVARSVNTAMVQAYWLVGREIVEVEQASEPWATSTRFPRERQSHFPINRHSLNMVLGLL